MKNNKKGFTLVELLAVIVILAIILVIAVPQIMRTIDSARLGAFRSTAKLLLTQAEKQHLVDQTLLVEGTLNEVVYEGVKENESDKGTSNYGCAKLAKLGADYSACKITVTASGTATLNTLTGAGKFANYSCKDATLSTADKSKTESANAYCSK